ncbi:TetR/AcrR family transcriptional regulator [Mycolicibacterium moriokaense]|uniref:TetR family transcriptional regulator n=1 Tax=Mycolicibacterium moriokaense TaxID=39691 RepID=A0A318H783_9MYCO|nr:TetR/AcrR family transcriptional regulator [Mycolicibacterium moriokaense]PXX00382.1 TetR family transcriptional regulator [Mycolicibacterium moriokaense]
MHDDKTVVSGHKAAPRPRGDGARRAILAATYALLGEVGYRGLSFEAVAERAGAARTTIYRHWTSKEDLAAAALDHGLKQVPSIDTGSLRGDIDALMTEAARDAIDPAGQRRLGLLVASTAESPRLRERYWSGYVTPRRAALRVVLERAHARGETRPDFNSDLVMDLMFGALIHRVLVDPATGPVEAYVRRAVDAVVSSMVMREPN